MRRLNLAITVAYRRSARDFSGRSARQERRDEMTQNILLQLSSSKIKLQLNLSIIWHQPPSQNAHSAWSKDPSCIPICRMSSHVLVFWLRTIAQLGSEQRIGGMTFAFPTTWQHCQRKPFSRTLDWCHLSDIIESNHLSSPYLKIIFASSEWLYTRSTEASPPRGLD